MKKEFVHQQEVLVVHGSPSPSHVLLALGLEQELAYGSLRVTFGEENEKEDVDFLINSLEEIIAQLRKH